MITLQTSGAKNIMHYSEKLKAQIEAQRAVSEAYRTGISELVAYLQSDKFRAPDNMVNVNDVLLRINEFKQAVLLAEDKVA